MKPTLTTADKLRALSEQTAIDSQRENRCGQRIDGSQITDNDLKNETVLAVYSARCRGYNMGFADAQAQIKAAILAAAEYIESLDKINLHNRLWGNDGQFVDQARAKLDGVLNG